MSKRCKYTAEEKYEILKAYEDGIGSMSKISSMYKIDRRTFKDWRYLYGKYGIDGLRESKTCKKYSKELKEQAVSDFLSGRYSFRELVRKYEISNTEVLRGWINRHNGHREQTATTKGMSRSMTKGRSTSWKERIEIVLYCIAHSSDYQNAAETYRISYQQVYQWVKKYESGGEDALRDRRGRKKDEEELTPEDRIKLAIKKLETENERLRAENAFLKKLEELERRHS
ncbi:MAG TPA: helix-turn-helix domain-containing protein [Desulfosporosinus sp.]